MIVAMTSCSISLSFRNGQPVCDDGCDMIVALTSCSISLSFRNGQPVCDDGRDMIVAMTSCSISLSTEFLALLYTIHGDSFGNWLLHLSNGQLYGLRHQEYLTRITDEILNPGI
jgi:hypothetical protein